MTTKYCVHWRDTRTNATGQCETVFDIHRLAQRKADTLDAWDAEIAYWVEPVKVTEDEQCPAD